MEQQDRMACRVYGRLPVRVQVEANPMVESGTELDSEGVSNLAFCLVRALSPDQTMYLIYQLKSWYQALVLRLLYEEGLEREQWLQVMLKENPLQIEYRFVPRGEQGDEPGLQMTEGDRFELYDPTNEDGLDQDDLSL